MCLSLARSYVGQRRWLKLASRRNAGKTYPFLRVPTWHHQVGQLAEVGNHVRKTPVLFAAYGGIICGDQASEADEDAEDWEGEELHG